MLDAALRNLKALSIRQPWAWAIVNAGKRVENRNWRSGFRGRFLIHAALGCTQDEYLEAKRFIFAAVAEEYKGVGIEFPGWKEMDRGGIVGVADAVDCVSESNDPWFMGRYGIVLENVEPLPFTPCKGALGFFRPELPRDESGDFKLTND